MKCKRCNGTGDEPDNKAYGRAMKKLRLAANIGLREMAGYVGYSHGFLSQLESGDRTWTQRLMALYQRKCSQLTE